MSLESDLFTALTLVCPRVFPDAAPDGTLRPYLTWQQIGGFVINPIANEIADKRNAFIQVNVWSSSRAQANSLMAQVHSSLVTQMSGRPMSEFVATFDEDLDLYGAVQDFSIWATR